MYQVISIGAAVVDIFIYSKFFQIQKNNEAKLLCQNYGDKLEVDSFKVFSGGGATNTAVGFARLGLRTALVCETGRDNFSQIILNELIKEGVETSFIIREKKEQTGGSVALIGKDGDRSLMVHRGAASMLDPYDIPTYWLSQAGWIHLSNIAGRELTLAKIFDLVRKGYTANLSWNPGKAELNLLSKKRLSIKEVPCQVLILNKEEWQSIENVQHEVLHTIPQIVITDSVRGGDVFIAGKHLMHYQAKKVKAVDNTGAGDAFISAYVAGQIIGKMPQDSIDWGIKNAASVVKYYGSKPGLLTREMIEK